MREKTCGIRRDLHDRGSRVLMTADLKFSRGRFNLARHVAPGTFPVMEDQPLRDKNVPILAGMS